MKKINLKSKKIKWLFSAAVLGIAAAATLNRWDEDYIFWGMEIDPIEKTPNNPDRAQWQSGFKVSFSRLLKSLFDNTDVLFVGDTKHEKTQRVLLDYCAPLIHPAYKDKVFNRGLLCKHPPLPYTLARHRSAG